MNMGRERLVGEGMRCECGDHLNPFRNMRIGTIPRINFVAREVLLSNLVLRNAIKRWYVPMYI
jgi:hypothetical protein